MLEENGQKITFSQAKNLLDTDPDAMLVDVREEEEYREGHAVGAHLLPLGEIEERASSFFRNDTCPILLYCRSGNRSADAAQKLIHLGYQKVYDLGGLNGWPYGITVGEDDLA